jgi:cytochrome b subunit of formate dehydrogenase
MGCRLPQPENCGLLGKLPPNLNLPTCRIQFCKVSLCIHHQNSQNMAQKPLSEMSLPELEQRAKGLKFVLYFMGSAIFVMVLSGVYLTYLQGFNVFTILPFMFIAILFGSISQLKKINQEIESRK